MDGPSLEENDLLHSQPKGLWLDFADESADMTIRIGGHRFRCQKWVLLPRCRFFRHLCRSVDKPRHTFVEMAHFPGGVEIFQTILDFCYGSGIRLVADNNFLYLSHGATILGMSSSPAFAGENLLEVCDKFWRDHMVNSWKSVFRTLGFLGQTITFLPKSQSRNYKQKCMEALRILIKDMAASELHEFIRKLILLPEHEVDVIVSGLRTEWPVCHGNDIVESFVLAAKEAAASKIDALALVAKSLVEGSIRYINAEDQEEKNLKTPEEEKTLSIPTSASTRVYILILIDGVPLKDEPVLKLRRDLFQTILPSDLGTSSPSLALKLIKRFIEDEYKLLHFERTGTNLLRAYLGHCQRSMSPLPYNLFMQFAKALSLALRDSHNILYDEIKLYKKKTSLTHAEKQKLEHLVSCATLSSDRLKEVIMSNFSCALGTVALALAKENEELKEHIRKKRPRNCSCSCPHESSQISRGEQEREVECDMKNFFESSQVSGLDAESNMQIVCNVQEQDVKIVVPLDSLCASDLSKYFYISVMTTEYMCLSLPEDILDSVAVLKKKIAREMELNSLTVPPNWHLVYKGKRLVSNSTLHDNGVEMYGVVQMQVCWSRWE